MNNECLNILGKFLGDTASSSALSQAGETADRLANQRRGSKSIDGCGHAAVSASYAVANAVNGRATQAASYSSYAIMYAQGGYAAVADRDAFESEFTWQLNLLRKLAAEMAQR